LGKVTKIQQGIFVLHVIVNHLRKLKAARLNSARPDRAENK